MSRISGSGRIRGNRFEGSILPSSERDTTNIRGWKPLTPGNYNNKNFKQCPEDMEVIDLNEVIIWYDTTPNSIVFKSMCKPTAKKLKEELAKKPSGFKPAPDFMYTSYKNPQNTDILTATIKACDEDVKSQYLYATFENGIFKIFGKFIINEKEHTFRLEQLEVRPEKKVRFNNLVKNGLSVEEALSEINEALARTTVVIDHENLSGKSFTLELKKHK